MTATMQQLKTAKNRPETIIDNTKTPFISPLDLFIENNCKHCHNYQGLCRPNDSRGLTPMLLCITLFVNQPPLEQIEGILSQVKDMKEKTSEIAEKTLQEAEIE
jgi:hypothetical protein